MAEILEKLRPDRDLQCYFQQPSAIAAFSETSANGFVVSGSWRQQFDWAVIEWNRDNGFEHPAFRNLPDGDLRGLTLTYEETRTNCIPLDCDLWPAEWAYLRVWPEGATLPYLVPLAAYATPIETTPVAAFATLTLQGTVTEGDHIGVAWPGDKHDYQLSATDTLDTAVEALASIINGSSSSVMSATPSGAQLTLTSTTPGANGNRGGVYGYTSGARTEFWSPWWQQCHGGISPSRWSISLDFDQLQDYQGNPVPTQNVRKLRWTYSAGWQHGAFQRSDFEVRVGNWTVTGANRSYQVAAPTSRRIEDDSALIQYSPDGWEVLQRPYNYSGGSYRSTTIPGARFTCTYAASATHTLYLGTELFGTVRPDGTTVEGAQLSVTVDGKVLSPAPSLKLALEDQLVRVPLGQYSAGSHTVLVTHAGTAGSVFNFDFLEIAIPTDTLPTLAASTKLSLATDWDTYHSICLSPERTAWMIDALGFHGRVNHYVGALWWYELQLEGHQYASQQIQFDGTPTFSDTTTLTTEIWLASTAAPGEKTVITHVHYIGDTAATIAKAFELDINRGSTTVRAVADGSTLTIYARNLGSAGNSVLVGAGTTDPGSFQVTPSQAALAGGTNGTWYTDLSATPRLNRAARDWHRCFFAALKARGLDVVAALSTELGNGNPSVEAGIAQRCPEGDPVIVNTPALQTNFSPTSVQFWQQAYADLASLMSEAGLTPYVQFGETQWWYFRDDRSGMPFYDNYTKEAFQAVYKREMRTISDQNADPADFAEEMEFLPTLIGQFTSQIMNYVRGQFPKCRFEVLYSLDVNETALDQAVNFPAATWTPATLDCLKTESFGYTGVRNLEKCRESIGFPALRGFSPSKSAHLIGISDPMTPWQKEAGLAQAEGVESVVLFALDQLCLIGYPLPLPGSSRRSTFQG